MNVKIVRAAFNEKKKQQLNDSAKRCILFGTFEYSRRINRQQIKIINQTVSMSMYEA